VTTHDTAHTLRDEQRLLRDFAQVAVLLVGLACLPYCARGTLHERARQTAARVNRSANAPPGLPRDLAALERFPAEFGPWFADAFGWRAELVALYGRVKVLALRESPMSNLLVGPERWVFALGYDALDAARGLAPLTAEEVDAWRTSLEQRRDWLAARGIGFVFALAPDKAAVYPEQLPRRYEFHGPGRLTEFVAHMAQRTSVVVPDLLTALQAAKRDDALDYHLYSPLGVHWRASGAYACYGLIAAALQERWPDLVAWTPGEFERVPDDDQSDSWAARLFLERVLVQHERALVPARPRQALRLPRPRTGKLLDTSYELRGGPARKALVLHDSFGPELLPFLAEHFERLEARRSVDFDTYEIEALRPDVVIQVYSEHTLISQTPDRVASLRQAALAVEFRAATEVVLAVRSAAGLALHPLSGAATLSDVPGGVHIAIEGPTAIVEIPDIELPRRGERWAIGLDVTMPTAGRAAVFYMTPGDTQIDRRRVYMLDAPVGRTLAVAELGTDARPDGLAIGFGRPDSGLVLHRVEVRRLPGR